jgi:hypothetical protein
VTDLWAAVQEHGSKRAAARALGMAESTFRARLAGSRPRLQLVADNLSSDVSDTFAEVPVIRREYPGQGHHFLYPLGDLHIGASMHDAARWQEWVDYLDTAPNVSMLGTGDMFNAAIIGSKSDTYEETGTVGDLKWGLIDQLKPLAAQDKLDALSPGNHENRITRAVGDCPVRDVARFLGVPYYRHAAIIHYVVGNQSYDFYVRHGVGNGQSLTALFKGAMVAQADGYIVGHTHRAACTADEYFVRQGDRVVRKRRYYVNSGSFLAAEGYALERGYTPSRLGAPRIFLNGERHEIHVSV